MLSVILALTSCASPTLQDEPVPSVRREVERSVVQERVGCVLKLYEVRDLMASIGTDFPGPTLGIARTPTPPRRTEPIGELGDPEEPVDPRASPLNTRGLNALLRALTGYVQPAVDDPAIKFELSQSGTLVVNALPAQHDWIARSLSTIRNFDGVIQVSARFYSTPRGVMREWKLAPSATLATLAEFDAFARRVTADGRFDVMLAPQLTTLACQRASIAATDQVAFIKDWTIQIIEPGRQEIADPNIAVIDEGAALDVRATPLPDGSFGLDLELQSCEIERPIPTRMIRVSASNEREVEIGEPKVHTAKFSANVVLADGASVVLVTAGPRADRDLAVVVTVRRVARDLTGK